mgnify:CR=1 FL=1
MLNFNLNVTEQIAVLVLQLGIIIFAAKFCGSLAKKCKIPSVLGELVAGIIIGPYLLGRIPLPFLFHLDHGLFGFAKEFVLNTDTLAFSAKNVTFQMYHSSLYAFATIGSVILLFMSGLETDLKMFFRYSLVGTIVGLGGVVFSFVFGDLVGVFLLGKSFMSPCSLFLGILCTATSVGITARILSEQKKVDSPEGVTILAAAVIDDVLGIICLAVVMGIVMTPTSGGTNWVHIGLISLKCIVFWLVATALGLFLAKYIAKFLKIFKSPIVFGTLSLGLAMLVSGIFEANGLSMIIGAYVMGLSLSKTDVAFGIQSSLEPIYNFFVPVFFVVMGMLVDINVFTQWDVLKIGIIYSVLAILAKIIGCALPALFLNFNLIGSLRIGTGMVPRGEVALIIAGIGMTTMCKGVPILDEKLFGVAIIMTLATTLLAPPLLSFALSFPGIGVKKETKDVSLVHTSYHMPSELIRDFFISYIGETLSKEGYLFTHLDKENSVMQIRKDDLSFALNVNENTLEFESNKDEVFFIKNLMYEISIPLGYNLEKLQELTKSEDLCKSMFSSQDGFMNENSKQIRSMVAKCIRKDCIIMDLKADDISGVIRELIDLLNSKHLLTDEKTALIDVLERENSASTCFQNGIALPHARTEGVDHPVAAVGISKQGYVSDSLDGKPSKIFVMILSPKNADGPHIEFLSAVGVAVSQPGAVEAILQATSPDEVLNLLCIKKQSEKSKKA